MRGRWLFAAFGAGALIAGLVVGGVAGAAKPEGTAAANSGRVIPLESNVVLGSGEWFSYAAVDTSDCDEVIAHWRSPTIESRPVTFRMAASIPGDPIGFGQLVGLLEGNSSQDETWHRFGEGGMSGSMGAATRGASGVNQRNWEFGPETILSLNAGNAGSTIDAAYLYCIPR